MRSVFVRTYLILAAVVLAALAATWGWGVAVRHPPPDGFREAALNGPSVVHEAFSSADDEEALRVVQERLRVRALVLPRGAPLPPDVRRRLADGLPAIPPPGAPPVVWIELPDGRVVELRPAGPPPRPPWPWIAAGTLVALGAATAWQLRPLDRALERLGQATIRLAAGDLSVRVQLPRSGPVGELAARFDDMAMRLDRLVRGRTELLLAVSHELRTPLQRIRLATELLVDSRGDEEERRTLADGLERDLDELDALVAELLDLGRLEVGPQSEARTRVDEVVAAAAALARPLGCEVTVESVPAEVRGDPNLLKRAIGNLVQNAARYGNGRVRITVSTSSAGTRVAVEDDGPGVPEGQRERVFEPFVRLEDARDRARGGVGLGLAIVARIVRQHGGEVRVSASEALGGACFEVHFPAADVG